MDHWMQAKVITEYKPEIKVTLLIPDMKRAEEMAKKGMEYFKSTRHIIVYYEDLVSNHTKMVDVQDFLRIPQRKLKSRQVKIHTEPLSKQVANWDAVREALKDTEFSYLLDK